MMLDLYTSSDEVLSVHIFPSLNVRYLFLVALDLAFVVDGTRVVGPDTFSEIIKFVKLIYHVFPVSAKGTHIGMVTFANAGNMVFNFRQHRTMKSLDMAVDQLKLPGGDKNNVGAGLATTHSQLFGTSGRKRPCVKKAVVTFLVGKPDDDVTVYANKMKSEHVVSVVIAINSDMVPVKLIASSSDHILSINTPKQMSDYLDKVIEMIDRGMLS
jgi:hypothetical protein